MWAWVSTHEVELPRIEGEGLEVESLFLSPPWCMPQSTRNRRVTDLHQIA